METTGRNERIMFIMIEFGGGKQIEHYTEIAKREWEWRGGGG